MVSTSACTLFGSTIPVVPRIDIPPWMPSCGLKVFLASASPSGTNTVSKKVRPHSLRQALCLRLLQNHPPRDRIDRRCANRLFQPWLCHLPTPTPPSITILVHAVFCFDTDQGLRGDIDIVSCVLTHATADPAVARFEFLPPPS